MTPNKTYWLAVFKKKNGKLTSVRIPGGLHESEALRWAHLKAPPLSLFVKMTRIE